MMPSQKCRTWFSLEGRLSRLRQTSSLFLDENYLCIKVEKSSEMPQSYRLALTKELRVSVV